MAFSKQSGSTGVVGPPGPAGPGAPAHVHVLADYADLPSALTAIGGEICTLIVSSSATVAASATIPATMALFFEGQGALSVNVGQTVTIAGVISAPEQRIFTGAGTVVLAAGTVMRQVSASWWGVVADCVNRSATSGTDNTAALNAATAAIPAYGGVDLLLPRGPIRHGGTWNFINNGPNNYRSGFKVKGTGSRMAFSPGIPNNPAGTFLLWSGDAVTPQIAVYSQYMSFEGIATAACGGKTALCAWDIDHPPAGGTSFIATHNRWKDCLVIAGAALGGGGLTTDGWRLANTNGSNCEQMSWEDCQTYYCTHAGIYNPSGSYQQYNEFCINCDFLSGQYGVYSNSGQWEFRNCNLSHNTVRGFYGGAENVTATFYDCQSEGTTVLAEIPAGVGGLAFIGGRFALDLVSAAPTTAAQCFIQRPGSNGGVTLIQVSFDSHTDKLGISASIIDARSCLTNNVAVVPWWPIAAGTDWGQNGYRITVWGNDVPDGYWAKGQGAGYARQSYPLTIRQPLDIDAPVTSPLKFVNYPVPPQPFNAMTVLATGGSIDLTRFYDYQVTYVTAAGESTPSQKIPAYARGVTATGQITLTSIPIGPPGVTSRKIYRLDEGANTWSVFTIANNTATTFTDTGANMSAGVAPPGADTSGLGTFTMGALTLGLLTAATATTGANGAPPAQVDSYIVVNVNGVLKKIPLYAL